MIPLENSPSGNALVVGGGIGGIQCALDLADAGFHVYLIDKSPTLGGVMAQLDKTFPTNDCSTCMFSPKLVEAAGHQDIEIMTSCRLVALDGDPGRFKAKVERAPRYVNMDKCIACGQCAEKCPKKVPDPFNGELGKRKAAYLTFPQAVPLKYALDPEHCLYLTRKKCGLCKKICPVDAIEFDQKPDAFELDVGAVVLSSGFELALTKQEGEYGFGRYDNVVTSLQFERMLSATGPYGGHPVRPSDAKTPKRIAWIQCVMSRDPSRNRPFCSSVCCMHAAKQAVLTKSHVEGAETTIYFMDIRAHGKGFDDYIERARSQHGVRYRRSMISQVYLNPENDNLIVETFDTRENRKLEEEYDLVVLSTGFKPPKEWKELAQLLDVRLNPYGFAPGDFDEPVSTSRPGVFVCGAIESPKDIPETVVQAGAAAAEVATLLAESRNTEKFDFENSCADDCLEGDSPEQETADYGNPQENEEQEEKQPKVGVFVCHCGSNIAGVVDVQGLLPEIEKIPGVAFATDFMFTCSAETQDKLVDKVKQHRPDRVVVAACSPKTHEPLFRQTFQRANINPYLVNMANIRNHCSWVHGKTPEMATKKALELIRAAVARAKNLEPLQEDSYETISQGLVVGGGLAGMTAALTMARQGFKTHLVEKAPRLGGFALNLTETADGSSPPKLARLLEDLVRSHPDITVHTESRMTSHEGFVGAFKGSVEGPQGRTEIEYGAVVNALGAVAYEPKEYLYKQDERVVTQIELASRIRRRPQLPKKLKSVAMIQCVGSRNEEFPYCSRVCCTSAVKNAIDLKKANPGIQVVVLYRDLRTFGFKELFYEKARKMGVLFFRFIPQDSPKVHKDDGLLVVDFTDRSSRKPFRLLPDLLVLSAGMRPAKDSEEIARLLKLSRTAEGFFMEAHVKLRPVESTTGGIFLAGLAHSPRFADEAITMAKCAAQQATKILCRKRMPTSPAVAVVDPDLCTSCLVCVRVCPFDAPFINKAGVSEIPPAKCQGCGICTSECPAKAITLKHSTDRQICAKIDALLEDID